MKFSGVQLVQSAAVRDMTTEPLDRTVISGHPRRDCINLDDRNIALTRREELERTAVVRVNKASCGVESFASQWREIWGSGSVSTSMTSKP